MAARRTRRPVLLLVAGLHPRDGGPPRVVVGSAVALARAGVPIEIAAMAPRADHAEIEAAWPELAAHGVVLHLFARSAPPMLGYSRPFDRFVRDEIARFDAVHVHGIWEVGLAAATATARRAGTPTFVSPHGMLDRWQMRRSRFKKRVALGLFGTRAMLDRATALLYGTREEANEAAPLRLAAPVAIMPNGVDPLALPDPAAARAALHARFPAMARWTRTVLFFSRLHPKKGLDLLVEAMAAVAGRFPDAGLLAVAIPQDERYEAALRARIAAVGDGRIVLVTDMVGPAARAVFAAADIFALPSHQEGFSIAILEAVGAGLPALITDRCHMPELAERGVGVVVPVTVDGLRDGLERLLAMDAARLAAMGRAGRDLVADAYSWDRIAARLIALYDGSDRLNR